jgi:hypothetical protein
MTPYSTGGLMLVTLLLKHFLASLIKQVSQTLKLFRITGLCIIKRLGKTNPYTTAQPGEVCRLTGIIMGMVNMRWAFKYHLLYLYGSKSENVFLIKQSDGRTEQSLPLYYTET